MIELSTVELSSALAETNEALRAQQDNLENRIAELIEENWSLKQVVYALENPMVWKELCGDPERVEALGITYNPFYEWKDGKWTERGPATPPASGSGLLGSLAVGTQIRLKDGERVVVVKDWHGKDGGWLTVVGPRGDEMEIQAHEIDAINPDGGPQDGR